MFILITSHLAFRRYGPFSKQRGNTGVTNQINECSVNGTQPSLMSLATPVFTVYILPHVKVAAGKKVIFDFCRKKHRYHH